MANTPLIDHIEDLDSNSSSKLITPSGNSIGPVQFSLACGQKPSKTSVAKRSQTIALASSGNNTFGSHEVSPSAHQTNRPQPSKIFISKCQTELKQLLESILITYHDQIKELYTDDQYCDLFVHIGEEFNKPVHRCILAARAFKLYSALKAFKYDQEAIEQDIIVSQFQDKLSIINKDREIEGEPKETEDESEEAKFSEALEETSFSLPEELINPEQLLAFLRRLYLNTDISEEEAKLNQSLIDWLKKNKPDLIKSSVVATRSLAPDHRESFRTIQPDFLEQLSSSGRSSVMSPDSQRALTNRSSITASEKGEDSSNDNDREDSAFHRDESLTTSLTRTETFELISRGNHPLDESHKISSMTKSNIDAGSSQFSQDLDTENDDTIDSEKDSKSPPTYTPTTRTGLKPKTFTTPVDAKQRLARASKQQAALAGKTTAGQQSIKSQGVTSTATPTKVKSPLKTSTATGNASKANKATPSPSIPKSKPSLPLTRAYPISMERSQSPGTSNLIKGNTKNFIVANKKLVSQLENKRNSSSPGDQILGQNDGLDSENDATQGSEVSWRAFEPVNIDNLMGQLDQFSLSSLSMLADNLSRMFVGEILTDSIIEVRGGKRISAHKCILAARSAHLNDLISRQKGSSTSEVKHVNAHSENTSKDLLKVDLTEFSFNTVYYALLHMYSGVVKIPEDVELEEITKLAHQLHVSTLNQVCQYNLRMNYCHFFHKPCQICSVGVLKTLPLAWQYDYTDLYSKCLQWIGSHFASIFCLREFSDLQPQDLIEECYLATMNQLTPDNIIQRTIECQKLLKNLPRVKWTESIICLVGRLLEDFCHFVADNYEKILQSDSFLQLSKNCWECEILEENLLAAMNHLKPDSGCKTLIQLHRIECSTESFQEDSKNVSDSFSNLVSKMRKYCERYLLKEATSVVHCHSWRLVNPTLQKRIKDQAIIATDFDEPTKNLAARPKLASMSRQSPNLNNNNNPSPSTGNKSSSNRSTPESRLRSPSTTYLPPPKNKVAAARHLKVLK